MSYIEGVTVIGNCTDPETASADHRNICEARAGTLTLEKIPQITLHLVGASPPKPHFYPGFVVMLCSYLRVEAYSVFRTF